MSLCKVTACLIPNRTRELWDSNGCECEDYGLIQSEAMLFGR